MDLKSLSVNAIVSVVAVVAPAWLFLDDRFAHADDVKDVRQTQKQQYEDLTRQQKEGTRNLRRQMVEDKVFELDLKDRQTTQDRALLDRYKRELETLK